MTEFTAEQRRLRGEVRDLLTRPDIRGELAALGNGAAPGAPELHPWRLYRQLGARGLIAPHWPVRYGGRGLGWVEAAVVAEELALHGVPDTAIVNGIYNAGEAVLTAGTPAQRQRFLPGLASGRKLATALLTEPQAGSDLASLRSTATRVGAGWELSGTKTWNAKAHLADIAICAVRTGPGDGYAGISLFMVPLRAEQVRVTALDTTNVETLYEVAFDRLPLGDEHLVGTAGEGWPLLVSVLTLERAGLGYHGRAHRWLAALTEHLRQMDRPTGAEADHRVLELRRRMKAGRELAWQAVRDLAAQGPETAAVPAATAKWFNTELAADVVDLAHAVDGDLSGGASASLLVPAHREAVGLTLAAGTSEMMLTIVQANLRGLLGGATDDAGNAPGTPGPSGPVEALRSAHRLGDAGEPGPDLGRVVLAHLDQERDIAQGTEVLIASVEHGHENPVSPGPLKTEERPGGGWSVSGTRWAQSRGAGTGPVDLLLPLDLDDAGVTVVVVSADRPGVTVEAAATALSPAPCRVHLHDVHIEPADRLCPAGSSRYPAAVAHARLLAAGYLLGGCRRMLRTALERADSRHQFGRPVSANQSIGHALAAAWARTQGAWSLAERMAADLGNGVTLDDDAVDVLVLAAEATAEVTRLATRVSGAHGLLRLGPVQDFARLARYPAAALGPLAALRAEAAAIGVTPLREPAADAAATVPLAAPHPLRSATPEYRLVERRARLTPDAVALVSGTERMTYEELNTRANRVAHALRRHGVGPDVPVGVCVERSADLVVAVLGVLKAGGAYVPLDPAHPPARLHDMIDNSDPAVVITHEWMREWLPADRLLLCLDTEESLSAQPSTDLPDTPHPANLMYIMYTSGSTGRPKGVMVHHGAIANRMAWDRASFPLTAEDAVLQLTSVGFDPSVWEIFAALTSGARLIILPPKAHLDPRTVVDAITRERVTALTAVPAQIALLIDQDPGLLDCPSLRYVFCGGDVLPPALARRFPPHRSPELFNMYGPTEVSIDATAWRNTEVDGSVPIGRPIGGVSALVRDGDLSEVSDGQVGELWIGGAGLARGYLGRPAETAEAFRPAPVGSPPGSRVYRTGDRARSTADGDLEFHGRIDRQAKIRGHRVEPAEVESSLLRLPEVSEAAVLVVEGRLVGFVVVPAGTDAGDLRRRFRGLVPDHLVPAQLVPVGELARGLSGKIDYPRLQELAEPPGDRYRPAVGANTCRSVETETALTRLVAEVLGIAEATLDDEFFTLGGDSLSAAQLVTRASRDLRLTLTIEMLTRGPSLKELIVMAEEEAKE
ncbi:amino acid adenylation domain-containing protein [Streptomyces graminilatus]|uniref:amino acid adenylation domain-containing protein n=1 Tax=Streptomyces graminilatus TaxID=1464070 RepID=UPI00099EAE4C|nr:amino acid adenylation domain-containing protein [Streptomyces graminilatus]